VWADAGRRRGSEPEANDDRGVVLVTTALVLVVLVVFVGLAVDLGLRRVTASKMQRAADAGALAGVVTLAQTGDMTAARAEAERMVALNGFPP
jgi:Flp pilus assembly protein TadG